MYNFIFMSVFLTFNQHKYLKMKSILKLLTTSTILAIECVISASMKTVGKALSTLKCEKDAVLFLMKNKKTDCQEKNFFSFTF